jgi:hypothetical protein
LRLTRQIFEYTCAPGSGANDATKFVLVARRSWSQEIKNRKKICFSQNKKHTSTRNQITPPSDPPPAFLNFKLKVQEN